MPWVSSAMPRVPPFSQVMTSVKAPRPPICAQSNALSRAGRELPQVPGDFPLGYPEIGSLPSRLYADRCMVFENERAEAASLYVRL